MKPWYQSKKLWVAVVTMALDIATMVIGQYVDKPELATILVTALSSVAAILILAIGITDSGKEAAALRLQALGAKGKLR